jgi:hypothetical protein
MARPAEPIEGWWESVPLAFAEGARVGYAEGLAEALQIASDLYGPWRFDADAVVRALVARGLWPLAPAPVGPGAGANLSTPRDARQGASTDRPGATPGQPPPVP